MSFKEDLEKQNDPNILKVANYLLSRDDIKNNLEKENKSLKEMWDYICGKARKLAKNNCACLNDETVYGWAVHYYDEDEIKVEITKPQSTSNTISKKEVSSTTVAKKDTIKKQNKKVKDNQLSFDDLLGI